MTNRFFLPLCVIFAACASIATAGEQDLEMIKVVTRDISPDIATNSFAAKPKTLYRVGSHYGRVEEVPDPVMRLHGLIIYANGEGWMVNLWEKKATHFRDPGPTFDFHAPLFNEEGMMDLELGGEYAFMMKHHAALSSTNENGLECDVLALKTNGYRIVLDLLQGTQRPVRARLFEGSKPVYVTQYDEYETGLKPDMTLFAPPKDVQISEAKPDSEGAKERPFSSAEDVSTWMTHYYEHPSPELLLPALEVFAGAIDTNGAEGPMAGFLSGVFRTNPSRIGRWFETIDTMGTSVKRTCWYALWLSDTDAGREYLTIRGARATGEDSKYLDILHRRPMFRILNDPVLTPDHMDLLWGAFMATGDTAYLRKILEALPQYDERHNLNRFLVGMSAYWSLICNAQEHKAVLKECRLEAERTSGPDRVLIDKVIVKALGKGYGDEDRAEDVKIVRTIAAEQGLVPASTNSPSPANAP